MRVVEAWECICYGRDRPDTRFWRITSLKVKWDKESWEGAGGEPQAPPWESQGGEEGWEKDARQRKGARVWENAEMSSKMGSQNIPLIITSHCLSSKFCQKDLRFFCKIVLFSCNSTAESLGQRESKAWNSFHFAEAVFFLWKKKRKRKKLKSLFLFDLTWTVGTCSKFKTI